MKVGEAIKLLLKADYVFINQVGSHKKYKKGEQSITIPYHAKDSEELTPKIIKRVRQAIK